MAPRKKKTLEEKCIEMKARNQGINPTMVAFQFRKGAKQLLRKKGIKQKSQELWDTMTEIVVPDAWLINGLEDLQGHKMTFPQVAMMRRLYHAVTGTKNAASKDTDDVLNRLLGKVPIIVKHTDDEDDPYLELTDDELNDAIAKLAESVRLKRLPVAKAEVVEDKAKK
jgi:hypothetical protein